MLLKTVAFIGAGRVGTALAILLGRSGYRVVGAASRSLESAERLCRLAGGTPWPDPATAAGQAELVFLTTPDRLLAPLAGDLAARGAFRAGQIVIHTSGALSSEVLRPVKSSGAFALSLHPLQAFASFEQALSLLPGSSLFLEGDPEAVAAGREVVRALGGRPCEIPTAAKPLYHAAACIASNYLVTLCRLSLSLYEKIGIPQEQALEAIIPLIRGTVANIKALGVPAALTGPIDRGDLVTISGHLEALERSAPEILPIYRALARETARVAEEKGGLSATEATEVMELLSVQKEDTHG